MISSHWQRWQSRKSCLRFIFTHQGSLQVKVSAKCQTKYKYKFVVYHVSYLCLHFIKVIHWHKCNSYYGLVCYLQYACYRGLFYSSLLRCSFEGVFFCPFPFLNYLKQFYDCNNVFCTNYIHAFYLLYYTICRLCKIILPLAFHSWIRIWPLGCHLCFCSLAEAFAMSVMELIKAHKTKKALSLNPVKQV